MSRTPPSLLDRVGLTPEQVDLLPKKQARDLINFLIRWEAFDDALACLDLWQDDGFVTTMDARARALTGLRRFDEAAAVMADRISHFRSVSSEQLYGETLIRAGRIDDAHALAREMTEGYPEGVGGWSLLGDALLARGDLAGAERVFLHLQEMTQTRTEPSIGLATIALLRRDPVTSSAYASRAFEQGGGGETISVLQLKLLLEIFEAIPDENRLREVRRLLVERFDRELGAIVEQVGSAGQRRPRREERERTTSRVREVAPAPPMVSDLATIPVSAQELEGIERATQEMFGFRGLLTAQAQILASALRGENVLAVLPTGGGKSLCYQVPAFLDGASAAAPLTLVVSPLIALMRDQVENLPPALAEQTLAINSGLEGGALQQSLRDLANGRYRLVYAAPERLRQWPFVDVLRRRGLARLVIDEAHCVSSWGHDFRPDYMHIAQAHADLGAPPILALTATAPTRVRQDIEQQLFGRGGQEPSQRMTVIAADSFRQALQLSAIHVRDADEKQRVLLGLCRALEGSGIVYARTRALTEELATLLRNRGENAEAFHAGMSPAQRAGIQQRFIDGQSRILVATVAFGMGIDKPDIRFILHFGLPSSLEGYYQEAGRAGRDGQPARCVLIYTQSDKSTLTGLANREVLTVDFLRMAWAGLRHRMQGRNPGVFAMDDLVRDLQSDDTQVRVALGLLERAGLLQRHYDAPRSITLQVRTVPQRSPRPEFVARLGLQVGRESTWSYTDLSSRSGIDAIVLEATLQQWHAEGWLRLSASGRDALITIPPAPGDAQQRVAALVDRLQAVRQQQVSEIYAYARTRSCRHGYLAGYLGGAARSHCGRCDNCGSGALPQIDDGLPGEEEQLAIVLQAVRERSLGRVNLARVLRGDAEVEERHRQLAAYGALAYRSEAAIRRMIETSIERGLLEMYGFEDGGAVVQLTARGRQHLRAGRT